MNGFMGSNVIGFLVSLLITLTITPYIRRYCLDAQITDRLDSRSQHKSPIVRTGGLGIFISFISTLTFIWIIKSFQIIDTNQEILITSILIGSSIFFLIGLIDDLKNLSPFSRLTIQFFSSSLVWLMGLRIDMVNFLWINDFKIPLFLSFIFTIFWITGITNAINWLDGLDGLASGLIIISLTNIALISISNEQFYITTLSTIICGSCLGFLHYNLYPAKILMGDGGSYFLGFTLSILSILSCQSQNGTISLHWTFLIVLIPLVDMIYVIFKRIKNYKSPFRPDRSHLHHRILDRGFSHKKTVSLIHSAGIIISIILNIVFFI